MRARLICVGKPKHPHTNALYDEYSGRLARLGLELKSSWVAEEKSGGRYSDAHVTKRESDRLHAALKDNELLIALDRRGRAMDSERLARDLPSWLASQAAFVLGGPLGHHPSLLARADRVWSLGPLTLPHELARVLVVEQIYRAMTLIRGLPYHK